GSSSNVAFGGLHFQPINPLIYTGPFTNGTVFGFPNPPVSAAGTVDYWNYDNQSLTSGHTVTLSSFMQITSTVTTPEPASLALMLTGVLALAGVGAFRRRNDA